MSKEEIEEEHLLLSLAQKYHTDKCTNNASKFGYIPYYEKHFQPIRHKEMNILEKIKYYFLKSNIITIFVDIICRYYIFIIKVIMNTPRDVESIILELKSSLIEKYGDDFKKFYLVNFKEDDWQVLISTKEKEGERKGKYFKIESNHVLEDNYNSK